jgi:hypothetical protein
MRPKAKFVDIIRMPSQRSVTLPPTYLNASLIAGNVFLTDTRLRNSSDGMALASSRSRR